jgi:hypothetical protein
MWTYGLQRVEIMEAVVEAIETAVVAAGLRTANTPVVVTLEPDDSTDEQILISNLLPGRLEVKTFGVGNRDAEDRTTITVIISTQTRGRTRVQAARRWQNMANTVLTIATSSVLAGLYVSVIPGECRGPEPFIRDDEEGIGADGYIEFEFVTDMTVGPVA